MNELTPEDIQKMQQFEAMKKVVMGKILTKEAIERMGRLKLVKPDLAGQIEIYLMQLYKSGEIKGYIDDEQLKRLLSMLSEKKTFNIKR